MCVRDNKDVTTIIIKPLIQYAEQKIRRILFTTMELRIYERSLSCTANPFAVLNKIVFRLISAIVEAFPDKVG